MDVSTVGNRHHVRDLARLPRRRRRSASRIAPRSAEIFAVAIVLSIALVTGCSDRQGEPSPSLTGSDAASSNQPETGSPGPTLSTTPSLQPAGQRPGVPADIHARYWTANTGVGGYMGGRAGQVGTTDVIVLPSDEFALAADGGLVASFAVDPDASGFRPIVGPDGLSIIVRNVSTGETVRVFNTNTFPANGIAVGGLLFWAGPALPIDEDNPVDGGIQVIDLADPSAVPRPIDLPDSHEVADLGSRPVRQTFQVSASRLTLLAPIAGPAGEATYIVDVPTQQVRDVVPGLGLGTTDEALLVVQNSWDLSPATRVRLVDIATGDEIGHVWDDLLEGEQPLQNTDILIYTVSPGEGEMFVSLPRGQHDAVLAAVSESSGEVRDILVQEGRPLWLISELSSPEHLVLLPNYSVSVSLDSDGRALASLLNPRSSELVKDAFTVGTP